MRANSQHVKGFTLIELLVVIAIIGVLSSVVLAALNTARGKGSDATIKSNLDSLRTQSVMTYDSNGAYGASGAAYSGTCIQGATFPQTAGASYLKAIQSVTGTMPTGCNGTINDTQWLIYVPLATNSANAWCVDYTGSSKQSVTSSINSSTYVCP
jgi:prepilin-type N-terminal cleavage/methylation domain-containing protein